MFYHCIFSSYKLNAVNVFLQKSKCGFSLLRISQPVVMHSVQYWYFYLLSISILYMFWTIIGFAVVYYHPHWTLKEIYCKTLYILSGCRATNRLHCFLQLANLCTFINIILQIFSLGGGGDSSPNVTEEWH